MRTTMFAGSQMRVESDDAYQRVETEDFPTLSPHAVKCAEFTLPRDIDMGYHAFHSGADFDLSAEKIVFKSGLSKVWWCRVLPPRYSLMRVIARLDGMAELLLNV